MQLHLGILPPAQLRLWYQLSTLPKQFILYGGTAIALQLGHRISVDYDFFSALPLNKDDLLDALPFLHDATLSQHGLNTLNCFVHSSEGTVKFQFLCGLGQKLARIEEPIIAKDNSIHIASLKDLLATKLHTIQCRAEKKDYLDIYHLLQHGLSLADGLAYSKAIYGKVFDPGSSLRALCFFGDGDLNEIDSNIKNYLTSAVKDVNDIPIVKPQQSTIEIKADGDLFVDNIKIVADLGYIDYKHKTIFYSREQRKIFTKEALDDHNNEWLYEKLHEKHDGWCIYSNAPISETQLKNLINEIENK